MSDYLTVLLVLLYWVNDSIVNVPGYVFAWVIIFIVFDIINCFFRRK